MADLLSDFVEYLIDAELAVADGVDIFKDFAPDKPDAVIIIYEYSSGPSTVHDKVVQRSIQVVARSLSAVAAKKKAVDLYNALNPSDRYIDLTAERWCLLIPRQVPFKVKVDIQNRVYYGFNIGVTTYSDY